MPRVRIRKMPDGLWRVNVTPTRPGERAAERASIVTPQELQKTVAAKISRMKNPLTPPADPG